MVHSFHLFMKRRLWPCALLTALCAAPLATQARPTAPAAKPTPEVRDPLDPKASVPALRYPSSFAAYRRMDDGKPIPWRDANDTVNRIGGWRAYAREAQQPDPAAAPAAPAAPAASAAPAAIAAPAMPGADKPAGHSGHKAP